MHRNHQVPTKTYDIHPISIRQIKQGHPWVTSDKFTEKFHPKEKFIVAANRARPFALLLHDPTHKSIRGRVWSTTGNFPRQIKSFKQDLSERIKNSLKSRFDKKILKKRNNFYLIFGEGDQIPGLFVQYLNGEILIQLYMEFWKQYQDFLIQNILKHVSLYFSEDITPSNIWVQQRSTSLKKEAYCLDPNTTFKNISIEEYGVTYKVTLGKFYDHGLYTDMSSIRFRIEDVLKKSKKVLNLFSYTGAFSLFALKCGAEEVVSVDLSSKYIDWLEENIKLNPSIEQEKHISLVTSTKKALEQFKEKDTHFDFIISDPPSSSSDGKKRSNALNDYITTLVQMNNVLENSGHALIFLNTHRSSFKKFEDKIRNIITEKRLPLKVIKRFYLNDDCPTLKGFPEGTYLKGLLLKKVNPSAKKP